MNTLTDEAAMNNNPRLSKKKQVQLLVVLTILAWATQTLMHQWGFSQVISPSTDLSDMPSGADEKFVPGAADSTPSGTLEVRQEATVSGPDVKLKQVCRWSDADAAVFTPIADTTLLQFSGSDLFRTVGVDEISQTLHEAGVNVAMINFAGAASCTIKRSDAQNDPQQTTQQWIDTQQQAGAAAQSQSSATEPKPDPSFHTLRDLLVNDLGQRLGIPAETLQITFSAEDDKLLSLAEPIFKFDVRPSRALALGNVSWQVTVLTDSASKKVMVSATARAWEDEVVVAQPLTMHKVLEAADFTPRRVLVDSLPDKQLLHIDQCVGQEAAEDLKPGTVMTGQLVNAVPLVKPGQLVTINLRHGSVELRSVARAMEQGSMGQTIRVRNENTRDMLDVTVIGAQEGRLGDNDAANQGN
jgi:flagella basal body P-ring formation protein FlgA